MNLSAEPTGQYAYTEETGLFGIGGTRSAVNGTFATTNGQIFLVNDIKQSFRIPLRDRADVVIAASFLPQEGFAWVRAGWFAASWTQVLSQKAFSRTPRDLWGAQARAEQRRRMSACAVSAVGDPR